MKYHHKNAKITVVLFQRIGSLYIKIKTSQNYKEKRKPSHLVGVIEEAMFSASSNITTTR